MKPAQRWATCGKNGTVNVYPAAGGGEYSIVYVRKSDAVHHRNVVGQGNTVRRVVIVDAKEWERLRACEAYMVVLAAGNGGMIPRFIREKIARVLEGGKP
jgi:hypothetical protein